MMKRTLPVSMYFFFSSGKTLLWKAAQWPQVGGVFHDDDLGIGGTDRQLGQFAGLRCSSTGTCSGPLLRWATALQHRRQRGGERNDAQAGEHCSPRDHDARHAVEKIGHRAGLLIIDATHRACHGTTALTWVGRPFKPNPR